jgi:hypothetical protein
MALTCASLFVAFSQYPDSTQSPDENPLPDNDVFIGEVEDVTSGEDYLEFLDWLQDHPFDLNRASLQDLVSLPGVTEAEAEAVLAFRGFAGKFRRVDQLLTMKGGSNHLYRALSPYVVVNQRKASGPAGRLIAVRFRTSEVHPQVDQGLGSPARVYSRVIVGINDRFEAGGLLTKDPGERVRDGFASAHVSVSDLGPITRVVLGDFGINAAEGLVVWQGAIFSGGGAGEVESARRNAPLVVPYRSSNEFHHLRGIALSGEIPVRLFRIRGCLFWSTNSLSGAANPDGSIRGFYDAGIFSTDTLVTRHNNILERCVGGRIVLGYMENVSVGVTLLRSAFDREVQPVDRSRFSGQILSVRGIDLCARTGSLSFSAESASTAAGSRATAVAATLRLNTMGSLLLAFRSYDPDFDNLHASGFSDNGETRNERGVWCGVDADPFPWLKLHCWYDQFIHPWPTALTPLPVHGNEATLTGEMDVSRRTTLALRYSNKSVEQVVVSNDAFARKGREIRVTTRDRWSCTMSYRAGSRLTLSSRLAYTIVTGGGSARQEGYLAFQGIRVSPFRWITVDLRMTVFQAGSYEARMYALERDLPGVFASPPLYGDGRRWYFLVRVSPTRWLTLAGKLASTEKGATNNPDSPFRDLPRDLVESRSLQLDLHVP